MVVCVPLYKNRGLLSTLPLLKTGASIKRLPIESIWGQLISWALKHVNIHHTEYVWERKINWNNNLAKDDKKYKQHSYDISTHEATIISEVFILAKSKQPALLTATWAILNDLLIYVYVCICLSRWRWIICFGDLHPKPCTTFESERLPLLLLPNRLVASSFMNGAHLYFELPWNVIIEFG